MERVERNPRGPTVLPARRTAREIRRPSASAVPARIVGTLHRRFRAATAAMLPTQLHLAATTTEARDRQGDNGLFSLAAPERLIRFGFKFGKGGAHAARTIMLKDLSRLLEVTDDAAGREQYRRAAVDQNVLDKPTRSARALAFEHLADLYALDSRLALFRVFRSLWRTHTEARPVLALSLALARDAILRASASTVLDAEPGARVTRERMANSLGAWGKGRFSVGSLEAMAQRANGSWTQAGYLTGHVKKIRSQPVITPENVTFALFLGYLEGRLAQRLFTSDWVRVLDLPEERLIELTQAAAQRGLLVFRRTGTVMEVRFPDYLTEQEQEWLSEQA